jgi:hypothetical protein
MDDLIKNGTLKVVSEKEYIDREKNKNTLGIGGLLILIPQLILLFYLSIGFIALGFASTSGKSFTLLLIISLVGIFQFFTFKSLSNKKGIFSSFLGMLCALNTVFIIGILGMTLKALF